MQEDNTQTHFLSSDSNLQRLLERKQSSGLRKVCNEYFFHNLTMLRSCGCGVEKERIDLVEMENSVRSTSRSVRQIKFVPGARSEAILSLRRNQYVFHESAIARKVTHTPTNPTPYFKNI